MTKSLRPADVKSVYEVAEEDGGRSRARDQVRQMGNAPEASAAESSGKVAVVSEGSLMLGTDGFLWTSWSEAFGSIQGKTFYVFANKDAAAPLVSVPLDVKTDTGLARAVPEEPFELEVAICLNGKLVGKRLLKTNTTAERNSWILSINQAQELALVAPTSTPRPTQSSSSSSSTSEPSSEQTENIDYHLKGSLLKYTEGFFWNSWQKQYARPFSVRESLNCLSQVLLGRWRRSSCSVQR